MFELFRAKRRDKRTDTTPLKDIHSHILPGIDDGAKTMEESLQIIKKMIALGYSEITATPHIFYDYYPNTKKTILQKGEELRSEVKKNKLSVQLHIGAEYFLDQHFEELLMSNELLPIFGNHLLVEFSAYGAPLNLDKLLWEIKASGYCPIIAHPERYLFLQEEDYLRLLSYGCKFQINILSLGGFYGRRIQDRAYKILKNNWAEYSGTDIHGAHQLIPLQQVLGSSSYRKLPNWLKSNTTNKSIKNPHVLPQ